MPTNSTSVSPTAVFTPIETAAMDTALELARRGVRGANPLVGAVVLDAAGNTVATGYHRGAGTPHAEADALANLRAIGGLADPAKATMVVTLEPCNHTGRTGPCAQAIIDAGIGNVIHAVDDPHAPAAGGAARLREAGVVVRSGLRQRAATELNGRWFSAVREQRPFVTVRLAQTLDSRIAAADGSSQWITSAASREDSHALRRRIDAILVGTGTVAADNPRLTARNPDGTDAAQQPLRVVMGLRDVPEDAAIRGSSADNGGFVHLRTHDPSDVLAELGQRGVGHLMVEGGSRISGAFLAAGLADQLVIYLAPTLLGAGVPALGDLGIGTLAEAQHWAWDTAADGPVAVLGRDLKLTLAPESVPQQTSQQTLQRGSTQDFEQNKGH